MKIGFVGLGIMGSRMAMNLMKAGHEVYVYNRTPKKAEALCKQGAFFCASPAEAAQKTNILISMVSDIRATKDILSGRLGILPELNAKKTFIQMGTLSYEATLDFAKQVKQSKAHYIDAPVSGSKPQAEAAKLVILTGGDEKKVKSLKKVFLAMGHEMVYTGKVGNGTALKLCVNLVLAHMSQGLMEGLALAKVLKLKPELLLQSLAGAPALNAGIFQIKGNRILNREFSEQFPLKHMHKDVKFMIQEAKKRDKDLPVTRAISQIMQKAQKAGYSDLDYTALYKVL